MCLFCKDCACGWWWWWRRSTHMRKLHGWSSKCYRSQITNHMATTTNDNDIISIHRRSLSLSLRLKSSPQREAVQNYHAIQLNMHTYVHCTRRVILINFDCCQFGCQEVDWIWLRVAIEMAEWKQKMNQAWNTILGWIVWFWCCHE